MALPSRVLVNSPRKERKKLVPTVNQSSAVDVRAAAMTLLESVVAAHLQLK